MQKNAHMNELLLGISLLSSRELNRDPNSWWLTSIPTERQGKAKHRLTSTLCCAWRTDFTLEIMIQTVLRAYSGKDWGLLRVTCFGDPLTADSPWSHFSPPSSWKHVFVCSNNAFSFPQCIYRYVLLSGRLVMDDRLGRISRRLCFLCGVRQRVGVVLDSPSLHSDLVLEDQEDLWQVLQDSPLKGILFV